MGSIYEHAKKGTLTRTELQGPNVKGLDDINPRDKTTALGIAVENRDLKIARLLLEHGANPNSPREGKSPLQRACGFKRGPENVEERLIQLLLNSNADPNQVPEGFYGKVETPLITAVKTCKSVDILKSLVDHGADPNVKVKGKSAKDWARNPTQLSAMLPRSVRMKNRALEVAKVVGFVTSVVYWANRNLRVAAGVGVTVGGSIILKDAIKRRFNMTGTLGKGLGKYIKEDEGFDVAKQEEKEDLKKRMRGIIKENNLDKFFREDDPFLENVVERAVNLDRTNPSNVLEPKDLIHLALYQPILYCDDSISMSIEERKGPLNELAQRITSITTRVIPDDEGIELRFINEKTSDEMTKPSMEMIDSIMKKVSFKGWTEIGTNLRKKVLEGSVYEQLENNGLKRPVLVSIVTDGIPTGPDGSPERVNTLRDVIRECGETLEAKQYDRNAVRFQLSHIGDDKAAEEFLKQLKNDHELDDVLYITSERLDKRFRELHENGNRLEQWLLKLLLTPIVDAQAS
ncbi:hypothetical protein N8T08_000397 [Aspergillus melleus]|uniref:Uncharacterized protein n=1 Tax=Aspergillus melleus TaxID=138277 RepID=A0ACC3BB85_9EURO|nr:hypothetical protein N8T08_000397 [Aspergillus melleus]